MNFHDIIFRDFHKFSSRFFLSLHLRLKFVSFLEEFQDISLIFTNKIPFFFVLCLFPMLTSFSTHKMKLTFIFLPLIRASRSETCYTVNVNWNPNTDWEKLGFSSGFENDFSTVLCSLCLRCAFPLAQWHNYAGVEWTRKLFSNSTRLSLHYMQRFRKTLSALFRAQLSRGWRYNKWDGTSTNMKNEKHLSRWKADRFIAICSYETVSTRFTHPRLEDDGYYF